MGALERCKKGRLLTLISAWGRGKRFERVGDCWIWRGPVNSFGYGHVNVMGMQTAQRVTWAWKHGRIADGVLRNDCGNRLCVNPAHWREDVRSPSRLVVRRELMRKLHGEGLGIGEIADRVGCSRTTVWRFVKGLPVVGLEDVMGDGDDA